MPNGLQQSHKGTWKPTSLQQQYTHTGRECKFELTSLRVRDRLDKSEGAQGWKEKLY